MRYLAVIGFFLTILPHHLAAQNFAPPPGFSIENQLTFSHDRNNGLFGANPVVVLCLAHGEHRPILIVTPAEALAINGHARDLLKGQGVFVGGKKIPIIDPYLANDARSAFVGLLPGQISKACKEK